MPKTTRVHTQLNDVELERLRYCEKRLNLTTAAALREGINALHRQTERNDERDFRAAS